MNVLLIGMRASGKSTVGEALAMRLEARFYDLDLVVADEMGQKSAAAAIKVAGFERFRTTETRMLETLLRDRDAVIALGGGTPTAPGAKQLIQDSRESKKTRVVFLDENAQEIRSRIAKDGASKRPAILGKDPIAEVEQVLADRRPVYSELADVVVVPGGRSVAALVDEIAEALGLPRH
jgi:shikimate kinase